MMRGWVLMRAAVVLTGLAALPGCPQGGKGPGDKETTAEEAVPVEAETVTRGPVAERLTASATVESVHHVDVLSEVSGRVDRIVAEEGDAVKRGALLCHLDNANVVHGHAKAVSTVARLDRELKDVSKLAGEGAASRKQRDDLAYQLEQSRLTLAQRERDLANTFVRAPISGTVTAREIRYGEYVLPNRRMFTVVDLDEIVAKVHVPERWLPRLTSDLPATAGSDALKQSFSGRVLRVNPVVDARSGTVQVTVSLDPSADAGDAGDGDRPRRLVPGMFVRVALQLGVREQALLVPRRAVVYEEGVPTLFLVEQGARARRVSPVELGVTDGTRIEVLGGVNQGDQVITVGQSGLKDGAPVRVTSTEEALEPRPEEKAAGDEGAKPEVEAEAAKGANAAK